MWLWAWGEDLEGGACSHNLYTFGPRPRRICPTLPSTKLFFTSGGVDAYTRAAEAGASPVFIRDRGCRTSRRAFEEFLRSLRGTVPGAVGPNNGMARTPPPILFSPSLPPRLG